ncbi:Uncharacterised protein [Mycobacteroides abscessus subsp. abscessus]|nr:Uncharacterised protein [Mycobacteroides abscessus subsp. abscessus]
MCQFDALILSHRVVEDESITLAVLAQEGVDFLEALVDRLSQFGLAFIENRPHGRDGVL